MAEELRADEFIVIVTDGADARGDADGEVVRGGQKGWRDEVGDRLSKLREVRLSAAELEAKMNQFLQLVGRLFQQVDREIGSQSAMQLDEVQLQVEISSKGEVKLIAGGEVGGKGSITLKFKRAESKSLQD